MRASLIFIIMGAVCAKLSKPTESLLNHVFNSFSWIFTTSIGYVLANALLLCFPSKHTFLSVQLIIITLIYLN